MKKISNVLKNRIKNLKKGIKLEGTKFEDAVALIYDKAIDDVLKLIEECENEKSEGD